MSFGKNFTSKLYQGPSFEQFLTQLKLLVKDYGYADPDEMVRDIDVNAIGCYSSNQKQERNSFTKAQT